MPLQKRDSQKQDKGYGPVGGGPAFTLEDTAAPERHPDTKDAGGALKPLKNAKTALTYNQDGAE